MATLTKGITYGAAETLTNTKLHNLIDLGSVSNIVNADIDAAAGIVDTKLAQIITTNKVSGTAIGNLASIPSGAGLIPFANLSLVSIPNSSLLPLTLSSWVDGSAMRNIQSMPSMAGQLSYYSIVSSLASGSLPSFNGVDKFVGVTPSSVFKNVQSFTASGTWTKPAGVSTVYVKLWGAGGGTAGISGGGGGGAYAEGITTVTGDVTVTVGTGGGAGSSNTPGTAGGNSVFAGSTTITAGGGAVAQTGGSATNGSINLSGQNGRSSSNKDGGDSAFGGRGGLADATGSNRLDGHFPGGGGAGCTGAAGGDAGGAGANGMVIVYY